MTTVWVFSRHEIPECETGRVECTRGELGPGSQVPSPPQGGSLSSLTSLTKSSGKTSWRWQCPRRNVAGGGGLCALETNSTGLRCECCAMTPASEECSPFKARAWIPALPFPSCVTLRKSLNFSVPQCPHWYRGNNNSTYLVGVVGGGGSGAVIVSVKWVNPHKALRYHLAHEKS